MSNCYITFRSITGAQTGAKILEQAGLGHQMIRSPQAMSKNGCGYALRIKMKDFSRAVEALRLEKVPFQKFFQELEKGEVVEL